MQWNLAPTRQLVPMNAKDIFTLGGQLVPHTPAEWHSVVGIHSVLLSDNRALRIVNSNKASTTRICHTVVSVCTNCSGLGYACR